MNKKQLLLLLALVVVLAAAGTAFYYHRRRQTAATTEPTPKAPDEDDISKIGEDDSPVVSPVTAFSAAKLLAPGVVDPLLPSPTTDVAQLGNSGLVPEELALSGVGAVQASPTTPFPLRYGSFGPEVADLQAYLVREYGVAYPAGITAQFDGATETAVRKHLKRDTISHRFFNKLRRSLAKH